MKILSCYVHSFGKIEEQNYDFSNGMTVICEANSFGKTTLAYFLKAMFFGLNYSKKGGDNEVSRFMPWDNADKKFGGSVTFADNGTEYKLERYFGKTAKSEEVVLTNLQNGKTETEGDFGKRFLNLTEESFLQSTFIPQEAIALSNNADFQQKLAGMTQGGDENDFNKAIVRLDEASKFYKHKTGRGGQINQLNDEIHLLENEIYKQEKKLETAEKLEKELVELKKQIDEKNLELNQLNKEQQHYTEFLAKNKLTENEQHQRQNLLELRKYLESTNYANLESDIKESQKLLATVNEKKQDDKFNIVMLVLFALFTVSAVVCYILKSLVVAIPLTVLGIIFLVVFVVGFVKSDKTKANQQKAKNTLIEIIAKYVVSEGNYQEDIEKMFELNKTYSDKKTTYKLLHSQVVDIDVAQEKHQLNLVKSKLKNANDTLLQLTSSSAEIRQQLKDIYKSNRHQELTDEKLSKQQLVLEYTEKFETLQQTTSLIHLAKENLALSYLPRLNVLASKLLEGLTDNEFGGVLVDKDFNLTITEKNYSKPIRYFSRGVRETTLFCFRIALSTLVYDGKIPFVVLDDVFVNLDDEKFYKAMEFLNKLAQDTQIIYFTCHKRGLKKA